MKFHSTQEFESALQSAVAYQGTYRPIYELMAVAAELREQFAAALATAADGQGVEMHAHADAAGQWAERYQDVARDVGLHRWAFGARPADRRLAGNAADQ